MCRTFATLIYLPLDWQFTLSVMCVSSKNIIIINIIIILIDDVPSRNNLSQYVYFSWNTVADTRLKWSHSSNWMPWKMKPNTNERRVFFYCWTRAPFTFLQSRRIHPLWKTTKCLAKNTETRIYIYMLYISFWSHQRSQKLTEKCTELEFQSNWILSLYTSFHHPFDFIKYNIFGMWLIIMFIFLFVHFIFLLRFDDFVGCINASCRTVW